MRLLVMSSGCTGHLCSLPLFSNTPLLVSRRSDISSYPELILAFKEVINFEISCVSVGENNMLFVTFKEFGFI